MCSGPRRALQGPWGGPGQARRVDQLMDGGHGDSDHGPKSGFVQRGLWGRLRPGTGAQPCGSTPWAHLLRGTRMGSLGDRGSQRCENSCRSLRRPLPLSCLVPCLSRAWLLPALRTLTGIAALAPAPTPAQCLRVNKA